jgi:hypothetical protein
MSAESGRAGYTRDSFRLAVDAMCEEWDEWAEENQGTRECFEAVLRKALAQLEPDPVRTALVEALKPFSRLLADHHARLSDDTPLYGVMENTITVGDIRQADAALKAAGEGL